MPEETKPAAPQIDASNIETTYANVCRIAQTPNEVIVEIGRASCRERVWR